MKKDTIQEGYVNRIAALDQLHTIDTPANDDLDNIALLAALVAETPVSVIAFIDKGRWRFTAKTGINVVDSLVYPAFSLDTLPREEPFIVADTLLEQHFTKEPLFPTEPGIRFFASIPLLRAGGILLGFLIVADYKPGNLSERQLSCLHMLGMQVVSFVKLTDELKKLEKIEEGSAEGDEHINTIFQNAIDAVIVIDSAGSILQWNPKAETIFGWKPEEITGKYFHETLIHPYFKEAYLEEMALYDLNHSEPTSNKAIEIIALRKNNTEFDIALGISPVTIKGQRFFINFVSDITDRKLATHQLDKQKEFYENILNKLPADITVFDANDRYLFVNPGAIKDEELRKYILGKDDFQYAGYMDMDDSIARMRREQFTQVKNTDREIRWEDTIKDAEGNPITHLRWLFPVHDEIGKLTMVIGFGIDITERKLMEEKQTILVNQLSTQNTQLIDFCNIVSHNLRGPLVNMSMLVDFIEESVDEEEQDLLISKLKPVLDHLHTTFNELVESIQIKQDLEVRSENVNLEQCLQRTIDGLKTEINKSHALIEFNFEKAPTIYYPPKYLFSIFHNLVSNSLKYQSPDRRPAIKLETKNQNGKTILSVKDNGLGIDLAKHKDNIFKIGKVFHRHPDAKGFGLFMTRTQVEAMGGKIWAESIPGEGSTFFIEFKNQI